MWLPALRKARFFNDLRNPREYGQDLARSLR